MIPRLKFPGEKPLRGLLLVDFSYKNNKKSYKDYISR